MSIALRGIFQLKSRAYGMLTYVSMKDDAFLTVSIARRLSAAILLLLNAHEHPGVSLYAQRPQGKPLRQCSHRIRAPAGVSVLAVGITQSNYFHTRMLTVMIQDIFFQKKFCSFRYFLYICIVGTAVRQSIVLKK